MDIDEAFVILLINPLSINFVSFKALADKPFVTKKIMFGI